jgi:hypothetical protein
MTKAKTFWDKYKSYAATGIVCLLVGLIVSIITNIRSFLMLPIQNKKSIEQVVYDQNITNILIQTNITSMAKDIKDIKEQMFTRKEWDIWMSKNKIQDSYSPTTYINHKANLSQQ